MSQIKDGIGPQPGWRGVSLFLAPGNRNCCDKILTCYIELNITVAALRHCRVKRGFSISAAKVQRGNGFFYGFDWSAQADDVWCLFAVMVQAKIGKLR